MTKGAPVYCGNILSFHTYLLQIFANSIILPTPCSEVKHWACLCAGEGQTDYNSPGPIQYNETICWPILTSLKQTDEASEKFSEDNLDVNLNHDMHEIWCWLFNFLNFCFLICKTSTIPPAIYFSAWCFVLGCGLLCCCCCFCYNRVR